MYYVEIVRDGEPGANVGPVDKVTLDQWLQDAATELNDAGQPRTQFVVTPA